MTPWLLRVAGLLVFAVSFWLAIIAWGWLAFVACVASVAIGSAMAWDYLVSDEELEP